MTWSARWLLAVSVVIGGAWIAVAQVPSGPSIKARQITLTDAQGRVTAELENVDGGRGPMLTMYDATGMARVRMTVGPDGPHLFVTDAKGRVHDMFGGPGVRPATE